MILRINRDWRIASDPLQWIIQERRKGGRSKGQWDCVSFHRTLDSACVWLFRTQVWRSSEPYTLDRLEGFCTALIRAEREILTAVNQAGLACSPDQVREGNRCQITADASPRGATMS